MDRFLVDYGGLLVCLVVGGFFAVMNVLCMRNGRSGAPIVGGLIILVGGLTTPHKWLALLCLLDTSLVYVPYFLIMDSKWNERGRVLIKQLEAEKGFSGELTEQPDKYLDITVKNECISRKFFTANYLMLNYPKTGFEICRDGEGRLHLLFVKNCRDRKCRAETVPFEGDKVVIGGIKYGRETLTVTIELKDMDEESVKDKWIC